MTKTTIGIDISKALLDVATYPEGEINQFTNDTKGYKALVNWLADYNIENIVFESTGPYHRSLERFLGLKAMPFSLINPRHAKRFGQATGKLAKTDRADALMLAKFGKLMEPEQTAIKSQSLEELAELMAARRALMKDKTAANNRQHNLHSTLLKRQIKQRLKQIERQIVAIDARCHALIKHDARLCERQAILTSIPGLGTLTATIILCAMPELGSMNKRQTAALAGLAPITRQSGTWKGKSFIRGGRAHLRQALYMPALVAIRFNHELAEKYQAMIKAGKPAKVAIVAVMRKLIITANALLRDNRKWKNNTA